MQQFRVDLKTSLGLARKQISSWFWRDSFGPKPQTFMIPIYSTTVLYDTSFNFG